MLNHIQYKLMLFVFVSTLLVGCSSNQVADSETIAKQARSMATTAKATPQALIQQAQSALNKARSDGLDFFAPLHLQQAAESLEEARELIQQSQSQHATRQAAITAKTLVERAYQNQTKVKELFADCFAHLAVLEQLNLPARRPKTYSEHKDQLKAMIAQVERGDTINAQAQQALLLNQMTETEVQLLKQTHLTEAYRFLTQAEAIDASNYAPKTWTAAEKALAEANRFIETRYRDRAGVARAGNMALKATQKAYFVAQEATPLVDMDETQAEAHVLRIYQIMHQLAEQLETNAPPPGTINSTAAILKEKAGAAKVPEVSVGIIESDSGIEAEPLD